MSHHIIEIAEHITSRNPQRLKSGITPPAIADVVAFRIVPHRMRFTINLDRQAAFETSEIDYISAAGELASEAQAVRSLA